MNVCPWEEVAGFRSRREFDRFLLWIDEQVRAGLAREVPVNRSIPEGRDRDQKWLIHTPSGEVWRVVWPSNEGRTALDGVFRRVQWLAEPTWRRRERGDKSAQPFWRTGEPWEREVFLDSTERDDFMDWLNREIQEGRAKEVPVPSAVEMRAGYGQQWFRSRSTGQTWRLTNSGIEPLSLPESLRSYLPSNG